MFFFRGRIWNVLFKYAFYDQKFTSKIENNEILSINKKQPKNNFFVDFFNFNVVYLSLLQVQRENNLCL